jgi:hypothetical protein
VRKKMYKTIFISFIMVAMFNFLIGCYHFKSITIPEYEEFEYKEGKPDEIYVKTKDDYWYHFTHSRFYVNSDTLYGFGSLLVDDWQKAEDIKIAFADIKSIGIEDINSVTTGILWGIAIAGVLGIVIFFWWLFSSDKEIHPY